MVVRKYLCRVLIYVFLLNKFLVIGDLYFNFKLLKMKYESKTES